MNKKAEEPGGFGIKKTIVLISIIVLLVIVIIGISMYWKEITDKVKQIFPSFNNPNNVNNDLIQSAKILDISTSVLLNDGEGRCIVYEETNPLIKGYGVRQNKLWKFENGKWGDIDATANLDDNQMPKCEAVQKLIADEKKLMGRIKIYYTDEYTNCFASLSDPSNYIGASAEKRCGSLNGFFDDPTFKSIDEMSDKNLRSEILGIIPRIVNKDETLGISFDEGKLNIEVAPAGSSNSILESTLNSMYATNGEEVYESVRMKFIERKESEADYSYLFTKGCSKTNKQIKADLMKACYED